VQSIAIHSPWQAIELMLPEHVKARHSGKAHSLTTFNVHNAFEVLYATGTYIKIHISLMIAKNPDTSYIIHGFTAVYAWY
jgi:hypothetical protein